MELKRGKCSLCPPSTPDQPLVKGMCDKHYWEQQRLKSANKINPGGRSWIQKSAGGIYKRDYAQEERDALAVWFKFQIENNKNVCENCGCTLPMTNEDVRKSHQAHILPKSLFPSVAACLDNHGVLGGLYACGCHYVYDLSWERAQSMPFFKIALTRFIKFKHLIRETELCKLPDCFKNFL